jgi:hypothetical protein
MTLRQWADNGWLKAHRPTPREMADLFQMVDRDLGDALNGTISLDWRFGIAYNAALKLCAVLLHASGYRPEKTLQHYRTIESLALILGEDHRTEVEYLQNCRKRRNVLEYDRAGGTTERDVLDLVETTRSLRRVVEGWLKTNHPELLGRKS